MTHSVEMAELMKQINGKLVVYESSSNTEIHIDAILLAPPGGSQVSVKPYGYTPKEILDIYHKAGEAWVRLSMLESPDFCFASSDTVESNLKSIRAIAKLKQNTGVFNIATLDRGHKVSPFSSPSCPYG